MGEVGEVGEVGDSGGSEGIGGSGEQWGTVREVGRQYSTRCL